jgi:hypothetical protein
VRGSVISRILGAGLASAMLALLLWPGLNAWPWAGGPYLLLLAVTALCGLAVLTLTGLDLVLRPRRGDAVRPLRVFDIVSAAILLGFALFQLGWLSGWLGP